MAHAAAWMTRAVRACAGNVAMIFALALLPVVVLIGGAIDLSRAHTGARAVQQAVDAAALAAGRAQWEATMTATRLTELAQVFFEQNLSEAGLTCGAVSLVREASTGSVTVSADCVQQTTVAAAFMDDEVEISRASTVVFNKVDIDLAMMLDVTGSMAGSKISDLRSAARDLLDVLYAPSGHAGSVRVALAPYADSVNVGGYFSAITGLPDEVDDGTGTMVAAPTCVTERSGAAAYADTGPGPGRYLKDIPDWYWRGKAACPDAQITPLTDDQDALRDAIDDLKADGWTAGHLGTAFARYLIAPDWGTVWGGDAKPLGYTSANTIKSVILMTDGMYNTEFSGLGSSAKQAKKHCKAMKDNGVRVYAVAFKAPASAEATLRDCASGPGFFFETSTGSELREAYRDIAQDLMSLRIAG